MACDLWLWLPAGGVAIERRFNLARVVISAFQIQNMVAYILFVCVSVSVPIETCAARIMLVVQVITYAGTLTL